MVLSSWLVNIKIWETRSKVLTEEEKALFMRDLNIVHQNFVEAISINRGIPLTDVQKLQMAQAFWVVKRLKSCI